LAEAQAWIVNDEPLMNASKPAGELTGVLQYLRLTFAFLRRLRLPKSDSIILPPSLRDSTSRRTSCPPTQPGGFFFGFCRALRNVDR
jgi:hypothetical protein